MRARREIPVMSWPAAAIAVNLLNRHAKHAPAFLIIAP